MFVSKIKQTANFDSPTLLGNSQLVMESPGGSADIETPTKAYPANCQATNLEPPPKKSHVWSLNLSKRCGRYVGNTGFRPCNSTPKGSTYKTITITDSFISQVDVWLNISNAEL